MRPTSPLPSDETSTPDAAALHGPRWRIWYDDQCEICQACLGWVRVFDRDGRVEAVPLLPAGVVRGALLVSLPDVEENPDVPAAARAFAPVPRDPLPFPSLLVASRTDPYCAYDRADDFAHAWGSLTVDAGESGQHRH